MHLRLTTIFVCENRVLIRNYLCNKSTYGIHCVLSLQSQLRPNSRGTPISFCHFMCKVTVTGLWLSKYNAFLLGSPGYNVINTLNYIFCSGTHHDNILWSYHFHNPFPPYMPCVDWTKPKKITNTTRETFNRSCAHALSVGHGQASHFWLLHLWRRLHTPLRKFMLFHRKNWQGKAVWASLYFDSIGMCGSILKRWSLNDRLWDGLIAKSPFIFVTQLLLLP